MEALLGLSGTGDDPWLLRVPFLRLELPLVLRSQKQGNVYIYVYGPMYTYIYRERERETASERDIGKRSTGDDHMNVTS